MEALRLQRDGGVAVLTLARPASRNALDEVLREELLAVLPRLSEDDSLRALVIQGEGGAFCAGGDLKGIGGARLDADGWRRRMARGHQWLKPLLALDCPIITAVDGAAYGAGFSLALCGDFLLVGPRARFCMSFLRVGLMPDLGGLPALCAALGPRRARELVLSAREVSADEALRLGLASEALDSDRLPGRALEIAKAFEGASPAAVAMIKNEIRHLTAGDSDDLLHREAVGQAVLFDTSAHRDAVDRFLNKKPAAFQWPRDRSGEQHDS
ncbi:enoyl-CoA hydratase/isomerase family protein [Alloalcanivorax gelatiniphagus]|uniref:Enoyl-CoA hydratase/isomerase family protein n=1 Tax=Alloalcanivorax gelatiniphagus TaxID=1194167 RepID=A0ABY2XNH4_9GAMM|nr:enoyl-CoA hydratase/isomerase family protein [Alloalcanivorax gelatiniphagus]TMW13988.1 enoyl-CoA hydratase/isomerase family protein [Alloalcanivorax gelatiniphagus]